MRFIHRRPEGTDSEVRLAVHDPDATVADLVTALEPGAPAGTGITIDGRRVPPGRRLDRAGVIEGATVTVEPHDAALTDALADASPGGPNASGLELAVCGGLFAGPTWPLHHGTWGVGRDDAAIALEDPTVSRRQLTLRLTANPEDPILVTDADSRNGTWRGPSRLADPTPLLPPFVLDAGASRLRIGRPPTAAHATAGDLTRVSGLHPFGFNRPPRVIPEAPVDLIEPPRPPEPAAPPHRVGVAAVVLPLALAAVMVKVFGNPLFGLFALMGPLMLVGNSVEARRRTRASGRREQRRFAADLARFQAGLAAAARVEQDRREQALADPVRVVRRALLPRPSLWERRRDHADFLRLRLGTGDVLWDPPVRLPRGLHDPLLHPAVASALAAGSTLFDTAAAVELADGGVIGVVGPRPVALAVARNLVVQAVVYHGPADLGLAVFGAEEWEWATWLPQASDPDGPGTRVTADPTRAEEIARAVLAAGSNRSRSLDPGRNHGRTTLFLVDQLELLRGRDAPLRACLQGHGGPATAIIIAPHEDELPSVCATIVELTDGQGTATLHQPASAHIQPGLRVDGLTDATARRVARSVARFDDPESGGGGTRLPQSVPFLGLADLDPPIPDTIAGRWAAAGPDPGLGVPMGVGDEGICTIDLLSDGPHALIAGTTGSGKSELLRTLVAGLALAAPPELLALVLIDFKGGSAFDQCADLPHTVGVVTDLDEHLAARALRCLEAELRRRERQLRDAGVGDLTGYRAEDRPPLARLVVVIDEFATLAAELPDFVDALVSVAQRGRSLGVHLVLATQRPSGAVSDNIRANTNLRIALRVQDATESTDVLDSPAAAALPRHRPGRALARLGPGELVGFQAGYVSGHAPTGGRPPVELIGGTGSPHPADDPEPPAGLTDLARLVGAVAAAARARDIPGPRSPWPDPLPELVSAADLEGVRTAAAPEPDLLVPFALADDPDRQDQRVDGWRPGQGNLLLVGNAGGGTTTALRSIATALIRRRGGDRFHLYVIDMGRGELADLDRQAQVGAVVHAHEHERQYRLIRHLAREVSSRRQSAVESAGRSAGGAEDIATPARVVVLIDGLAALREAWPDSGPHPLIDELTRILAEGPAVGVHVALTADRPGVVPHAIRSLIHQQLVFHLADPADRSLLGLPRDLPAGRTPGRAFWAHGGLEVQVAVPEPMGGPAAAPAPGLASDGGPTPIRVLDHRVEVADLGMPAPREAPGLWLPLGLGEHDLAVVGPTVREGEHLLIAGPARAGRTTALATTAAMVRRLYPDAHCLGIADPNRSPLARCPHVAAVIDPRDLSALSPHLTAPSGGPIVLLVDDAERVDDPDGRLERLAHQARPGLVIVAAGRTDALRVAYSHWTRAVRASRVGILLQPDPDLDGDLLGLRLPRHAPVAFPPGRGWLVGDAALEIIQVASDNSLITGIEIK